MEEGGNEAIHSRIGTENKKDEEGKGRVYLYREVRGRGEKEQRI